ncbi:MAG: hypothetical protein WCD18_14295, partial [Thermosynechococcaceae cyanobacterium]
MDLLPNPLDLRQQYWLEVDLFFANLPLQLFQQGHLVRCNLTVQYGSTGLLQNTFSRVVDYPILSFHGWLLEDWQVDPGEVRSHLEKQIFLGMFYLFAASYTQENIANINSIFDPTYKPFAETLHHQAKIHFGEIFPQESGFWAHYQTYWAESQAAIAAVQTRTKTPTPYDEAALKQNTAQLAFSKIGAIAVAIATQQTDPFPQLERLLDGLNEIHQLRRDLLSIYRDIRQGRYTYPILCTLAAGNIPLDQPIQPEKLLGAMVLTGAVRRVGEFCLAQLDHCREIATDLNLPTWTTYCDRFQDVLTELSGLFSLKALAKATQPPQYNIFLPHTDHLSRAIEVSEAYLLADLSWQESWDIQRRTMLNHPGIIARAFLNGLILEVLCHHGHDLSTQVSEVFDWQQASQFRY